jgi:transcriptional regulator NrdR family protein
MNCPECRSQRVYVVMTKPTQDGQILRRRHCHACDYRWYSLQSPEAVIDGSRIEWRNRRKAYMPVVLP